MGSRSLHKLLTTALLKSNKGLAQKENSSKPTSLGALQRQLIAYTCNAHDSVQLHEGFQQLCYHHRHDYHYEEMQHDHVNMPMGPQQKGHVKILHHQPLRKEGIVHVHYHCHVHRDITQHPPAQHKGFLHAHHHHHIYWDTTQHHHPHHKSILQHHPHHRRSITQHHFVRYRGILQLHDHHTNRGFMQQHHHCCPDLHIIHYLNHVHTGAIFCNLQNFCSTTSKDDNDARTSAFNNVNGIGPRNRGSLAVRLQALCKANSHDFEASKTLESLVDQITTPDDPEGLLMGAACLKLATIYASENNTRISKGLSYAQRAIKAYELRGPSLKLATCLHLASLIYVTMGDFEKALLHLEQSASVMKKIKVTPCDEDCVALKHEMQSIMGAACDQFCNIVNFEVQTLFGTVKSHLGRRVEAAAHYRKSIKIKQKLLQCCSPELGTFYLKTAEALKDVQDPKSAKELCFKALKIFSKSYGKGSLEEAKIRTLLSKVHFDLGKYEDSLSESELAKQIWKRFGKIEEVMHLTLSSDRIMVKLKMWDNARLMLEELIQATALGSKCHTIALILAARVCALSDSKDFAAEYSSRALDVLEHQQACTQVAGNLVLLSAAYEEKKDYEQAAMFCKKATEMFDRCLGSHVAATAAELEGKTGCLLVHAEKATEAIPHLERSLSRLKCIPGADLVYVHFYLGLAYPQVQRIEEALEHFEAAKTALSSSSVGDATLSVSIYSNLAVTYSALNRFDEAVESQKQAVDLVKANNVEDCTLEEAQSMLEAYRQEAEASKLMIGS